MTGPLVSIIVPAYNQAAFLNECLQSVSGQSYSNWECIIINDGSTDNTEQVANSWQQKDPRFRAIHKQNEGVIVARNTGISQAGGAFILPLDGDDKISEHYLELAVEAFQKDPGVGVVYCEVAYFGEKTGIAQLPEFSVETLLLDSPMVVSSLFRKSDFIKIGGFDNNLKEGLEDWEFWINFFTHIPKRALKLGYTGFHYRISKQSRNMRIDEDKRRERLESYIFRKHFDSYVQYYGNPVDTIRKERFGRKRISRLENIFPVKQLISLKRMLNGGKPIS